MYQPRLELLSLTRSRERQRLALAHDALLAGLTEVNCLWLEEHPETPWLYESGVVYEPEAPGVELWADIPRALELGAVDCEDLACWRAAELMVREGVPAEAFSVIRDFPSYTQIHVLVRSPLGYEDPSRELGMLEVA